MGFWKLRGWPLLDPTRPDTPHFPKIVIRPDPTLGSGRPVDNSGPHKIFCSVPLNSITGEQQTGDGVRLIPFLRGEGGSVGAAERLSPTLGGYNSEGVRLVIVTDDYQ